MVQRASTGSREFYKDSSSAESVAFSKEQRVRYAGGPQDQALYNCSCGHSFHARVTASVSCSSCGLGQDW